MKNFLKQKIQWEEKTNACLLVTKWPDGSVSAEPATPEQAAQWQAENKF